MLKYLVMYGVSLVAQTVKNLPAIQKTWIRSLGWEDPLEEGMVTLFSILAWRIPTDRGAWRATVHGFTESNTTERLSIAQHRDFPGGSVVKNLPANRGDTGQMGLIPVSACLSSCSRSDRPLVELCVEPAGFSRRCTGVSVPLPVVPSPTGLPSKRGPGLGSF